MIKISNISKQYTLGKISSGRLADDINSFFYRIFKKEVGLTPKKYSENHNQ